MRSKHLLYLFLVLLAICLPAPGSAATFAVPVVSGLNLTAVTAPLMNSYGSAFPLLTTWKSSGITAIESYDAANAKMLRAELDLDGNPSGSDFPLTENAALFVYAAGSAVISADSGASCAPLNLSAGFNLAGYGCFPGSYLASELLHSLGPVAISSISRLDGNSGRWQTAAFDGGTVVGEEFPLAAGEGYIIHAGAVSEWTSPSPAITGLTPSQIGAATTSTNIEISGNNFHSDSTVTIDGLDAATSYIGATLLRTAVPSQTTSGALAVRVKNPDLYHAGGYLISEPALLAVTDPPLGLTPAALTVWKGQSGAAMTVSIPFPAPSSGTSIDLTSSNPELVGVATPVVVPQGAISVTVPLTLSDTGIVTPQFVTVTASRAGMAGSQAGVSVRPKPTIDLSPLTTLTGLSFTYTLTVHLSDVAPPGGLPVTLAAAPAGIVTVPASVTIPAGTTSAQVTVTGSALGSAVISASSAGLAVNVAQHAVTVKPVQDVTYSSLASSQVGIQVGPVATAPTSASSSYTPVTSAQVGVQVGPLFAQSPVQLMNYGPLASSPVGVQVGSNAVAATSVSAGYSPVASAEVGVAVGPVVTGMSPNHGAVGDSAIPLTVSGFGLNAVTGIAFLPSAGVTVGTLSVAADGLSVSVPVNIAANAALGDRTVLVTTASGIARAAVGRADVFSVTLPTPEIYSIQPLRSTVGQTVAMSMSGKNFASASSVNLMPSSGIVVSNPPVVSADGSTLAVSFTVAADAALGNRVVSVTTPGGTTSGIASVTNTFGVTSASDPGATHTSVSDQVGVLVLTGAATTSRDLAIGPATSLPVGITVGSTLTAITPASGNIGSSGLPVRALGIGLNAATGISFLPPDGITVTSFAIGGDGNPQATIDIAANAPVSPRTVLVALAGGGYAQPTDAGSNQFQVTLPTPQILSLQPIRAMAGQGVDMTIIGKDFGSASRVDFTPADGIAVGNPPTVSADGTMITIDLTIAANASLGNRVVTVTTPGGISSSTASTANSFAVTVDQGTTYTPLLSPMVGVVVPISAIGNLIDAPYGPVASAEVGVMVTSAEAPTSRGVDYGPLVSAQIGIAVGGVFTEFAPGALEPGRSATFTLTGVGLDSVTAVTLVPSDNLAVTTWTPAVDGRSGTVTITADAGAVQGVRSLVLKAGSIALASAPGVDLLQVGYKPTLNSITTTFPQSSLLAALNSTVTLTLNGTHLQGVTKVEVFPADGIVIDSAPAWFSDGTGEHVSVTMVVAAGAQVGDRLVRLTTIYGSSSGVRDDSNTLSIVLTVADSAPAAAENRRVAARRTPVFFDGDTVTGSPAGAHYISALRKTDETPLTPLVNSVYKVTNHAVTRDIDDRETAATEMAMVSRGPPCGGQFSKAS